MDGSSHPSLAGQRLTIENNPYRANRPWPPDFDKLGPKHQFRLERKYKRRVKQATFRPGWVNSVKLVQYGVCGGVSIYAVLFMDWGEHRPFEGVRNWARNLLTPGNSNQTRPHLGRIESDEIASRKNES